MRILGRALLTVFLPSYPTVARPQPEQPVSIFLFLASVPILPAYSQKERKCLFTPRGSWGCGQPAGLSKRLSGNCEAVIHGRGISTAVSQGHYF